ncbi:MAG TPA: MFS transporter [Vicinamibacterales bacterium]
MSTTPPAEATSLGRAILDRALSSLAFRDFRIIWAGAFASTIGTWMQKIAQSWLVFDLTKSSFFLGLDDFLGQLPILLLTILGGVIADRHNRLRLMLGSQYVQMTTAFTLAALVWTGVVRVEYILILSAVTGFAQAFGGPAYQALIPTLVPKAHLPNAIALNSIQFNLSRILGSLLAGVTLAAFGAAMCFVLNGFSFLFVVAAIMSLSLTHVPPAERKTILSDMRGGFSYLKREPALIALTIVAFLTTFLGLPLLTFLPVVAQNVFQGEIGLYSTMMAFSGAGSVIGALIVAWLGRSQRMGLILLFVQVVLGILIAGFSISRVLWLNELILLLAGISSMIVTAMATSLVQLIVPDHLRGRVVSIYMVALRGGMPLGSLASGYAATLVGVPMVLGVNGALMSIVGIYFLVRSHGVREL